MLPAVVGSSVAQINLLLDTIIASFLAIGSVTWLYYSDRMLEFPLGVLGIAIATVILPALSQQHANASRDDFNQTLDWALKMVMLIALPACIGLLLLASPILATLFQHGDFTANDSYMASLSLMAYMIGLPAFIMIKILAPGFYARQDTRTPVRIGLIAMGDCAEQFGIELDHLGFFKEDDPLMRPLLVVVLDQLVQVFELFALFWASLAHVFIPFMHE